MDQLLPVSIILFVSIFFLVIAQYIFQLETKKLSKYVIIGILTALIIQGFIYSIGKELTMNLYFFDVRIIGKDIFSNFEIFYQNLISQLSGEHAVLFGIGTIIIAAFLEEIGKTLMIYNRSRRTPPNSIKEFIGYSTGVAIGFSFFENLLYLGSESIRILTQSEIINIILLRTILSTPSHILFTLFFSLYLARSVFFRYDLIENKVIKKYIYYISILKKYRLFANKPISSIYIIILIFFGTFISTFLHIIYNLLLHYGYAPFALLLVIGGFILWYYSYKNIRYRNENFTEIKEKIEHATKNPT